MRAEIQDYWSSKVSDHDPRFQELQAAHQARQERLGLTYDMVRDHMEAFLVAINNRWGDSGLKVSYLPNSISLEDKQGCKHTVWFQDKVRLTRSSAGVVVELPDEESLPETEERIKAWLTHLLEDTVLPKVVDPQREGSFNLSLNLFDFNLTRVGPKYKVQVTYKGGSVWRDFGSKASKIERILNDDSA